MLVAQLEVDHLSSFPASLGVALGIFRQLVRFLEQQPGSLGLLRFHQHAHHRECPHHRHRLLGEALIDHARVQAGLAQPQRRELRLVELARLEHHVPVAVRGGLDAAHRSFQTGFLFSATAFKPSSTSCVASSWLR